MTFYLVRHGETDWNRGNRVMGTQPIPLNQKGIQQAERLAKILAAQPITALYSSPVLRTKQTAEILSAVLHVKVVEEPGLSEIGVGEWEGKYWNELDGDPARVNFYRLPHDARAPGGETLAEVRQRAADAVARIRSEHPKGTVVLVTHADVVRTILSHYLESDLQVLHHLQISHASVTALAVKSASAILLYANYTTGVFGATENAGSSG